MSLGQSSVSLRKASFWLVSIFSVLILIACDDSSSSSSDDSDTSEDADSTDENGSSDESLFSLTALPGDSEVTLSWDSVPDANSYTLYFSTVEGTADEGTSIPDITETSYTHTGRSNTTTYYYVVRSVGDGGVESDPSEEVSATPHGDIISERYEAIDPNGDLNPDGELIRDLATGLEWQRCSLGQTWNGSSCNGDRSTIQWDDATDQTASGGFRLPTKDELRTIVYCSDTGNFDSNGTDELCGSFLNIDSPTVIQAAFPSTERGIYWSATVGENELDAFGYNFNQGNVVENRKSNFYSVRLVR
ncbi:MAG: DUF1566 domain-containing protein [Natronospirillum sp.]|uniref:Lcl C-terminal domain-containing protein n=1 Tax=Natronospirillum sp. TaxID=2812955 RepID=UPI0025FE215F|nr:DUF1566 domain-containing protein [Natronospirillum sp.]MCH8551532.1 DUF1566 domain-containing protein [Natronospirillum sp.]